MFKMNINEFEDFLCKVKKVLGNLEEFCSSLEIENAKSCQEDASNEELDKIKADISNTRTSSRDKKEEGPTKKKTVGYLYKKSIRFLKNENIDLEMPYSGGFLANLFAIASSRPVIHHSHTSGKIVGFVHEFCNLKVRENYYTIPVIAHNHFEDYEEVKKFLKLINSQTLGELNKYYNIQDTLILCEIFEQRSDLLQRLFKFNPRKCNSASAFSG